MGKVKITAKTKANIKKKPVKAGQTMKRNVGGAANAKLVISVNKK
jgi:hypothetical protein